jgi:hypothetical protein
MRLLATITAVLALTVGFGSCILRADIPGVTIPGTPRDFGASDWNLGFEFSANSDVSVTALGDFDFGSAATFPQSQQVGLWDINGNLLASAYVTTSSIQIGQFAFTSITPVALTAGSSYVVGGQGGADYTGSNPINVAPQISYVEDLYTYIGTPIVTPLYEPLTSEGLTSVSDAGWFGGDVLLSSTPEPSYYLVVGAALVTLLAIFRARRKGYGLLARHRLS